MELTQIQVQTTIRGRNYHQLMTDPHIQIHPVTLTNSLLKIILSHILKLL